MEPLGVVVYSDFLCPWCFNAATRLESVRQTLEGAVEYDWRSYLLRSTPRERDLEKFRAYTQSWRRPAAEDDAGRFRTWVGDAGPPSGALRWWCFPSYQSSVIHQKICCSNPR